MTLKATAVGERRVIGIKMSAATLSPDPGVSRDTLTVDCVNSQADRDEWLSPSVTQLSKLCGV
jgi:hypothetical protein